MVRQSIHTIVWYVFWWTNVGLAHYLQICRIICRFAPKFRLTNICKQKCLDRQCSKISTKYFSKVISPYYQKLCLRLLHEESMTVEHHT